MLYGDDARLGTGTDALSTTQEDCHAPIAIEPTLRSLVAYVSDAFYREIIFEFPSNVVGNIAEFVFPMLDYSDYNCIAMRFPTPIPKTDTTKKIRLQPRITFGRAT
jgi:hypothetical protein